MPLRCAERVPLSQYRKITLASRAENAQRQSSLVALNSTQRDKEKKRLQLFFFFQRATTVRLSALSYLTL